LDWSVVELTWPYHLPLAGIPTIIRPFFGDQFFWADRVEALGIGSGVRRMTVDELSAALVNATTDFKQIARAKAIGKAIQSVRPQPFVMLICSDQLHRRMEWKPQ
jgi:hypothetical protein